MKNRPSKIVDKMSSLLDEYRKESASDEAPAGGLVVVFSDGPAPRGVELYNNLTYGQGDAVRLVGSILKILVPTDLAHMKEGTQVEICIRHPDEMGGAWVPVFQDPGDQ